MNDKNNAINTLDDFIMVVDGMIPQDCIDDLLKEYKTSSAWMDYAPGKSGGDTPATSILLTHPTVVKDSPVRQELMNRLGKYIFEGFDQYHKKYSKRDEGRNILDISELVGLRLLKYKKGQSIFKHVDKYTNPDTNVSIWPVVTFTLSINSNFSGGELELLDGRCVYEAKAGQCVFFPANFLFPHEVKTVTRGIRYAIVGWFV